MRKKENTATSGKLIIAVYALYVYVCGPTFQYSGLVLERHSLRRYRGGIGLSNSTVRGADPVSCHHLS